MNDRSGQPRRLAPLRALFGSWCCAFLAGCAAPVTAPGAEPPGDLALEVTIVHPRIGPPRLGREITERYVLLADGSLYWGRRNRDRAEWMPDYRRTLGAVEVDRLWTVIRDDGLGDPSSASLPTNPALLERDPVRPVALVLVTGDGRRWAHQGALGGRGDAAVGDLVDHLARLAWAGEPPASTTAPRRYDLGPDPYERYRR